ncbi:MAG: hypothetical protein KDA89_08355, partial [Planctomycetaceae bacterium]|nr:hypothetical protein [Planctomycetaceae bacterium]
RFRRNRSTAEAGTPSWFCSWTGPQAADSSRGRLCRWWLCVIPGLCGPLVISLTLLRLFQMPLLNPVYDTWLPMVTGHVLWLLPRAVLLAILLQLLVPPSSLHSARLLLNSDSSSTSRVGRSVLWKLWGLRLVLATAVLMHWVFWDVTIVAVLRPVSLEPIVTRLYSEMHWSHTESLAAMTLLSLLIPPACIITAAALFRRLK